VVRATRVGTWFTTTSDQPQEATICANSGQAGRSAAGAASVKGKRAMPITFTTAPATITRVGPKRPPRAPAGTLVSIKLSEPLAKSVPTNSGP